MPVLFPWWGRGTKKSVVAWFNATVLAAPALTGLARHHHHLPSPQPRLHDPNTVNGAKQAGRLMNAASGAATHSPARRRFPPTPSVAYCLLEQSHVLLVRPLYSYAAECATGN